MTERKEDPAVQGGARHHRANSEIWDSKYNPNLSGVKGLSRYDELPPIVQAKVDEIVMTLVGHPHLYMCVYLANFMADTADDLEYFSGHLSTEEAWNWAGYLVSICCERIDNLGEIGNA